MYGRWAFCQWCGVCCGLYGAVGISFAPMSSKELQDCGFAQDGGFLGSILSSGALLTSLWSVNMNWG